MRHTPFLIVIAFCVACAGSPPIAMDPSSSDTPGKTIYLVHNGWHSGIVVQVSDLPSFALPERADFPNVRYLELGWGDRDFYQARSIAVWAALKGAFLPTASAVHMVGFNDSVTGYFRGINVIEFKLSDVAMERLARYLHDSIDRGGMPRASALGPGLYGLSKFYPAKGKFHMFNTCHVWTAGAMRASGYPFSARPTEAALLDQAMRLGNPVQTAANFP